MQRLLHALYEVLFSILDPYAQPCLVNKPPVLNFPAFTIWMSELELYKCQLGIW